MVSGATLHGDLLLNPALPVANSVILMLLFMGLGLIWKIRMIPTVVPAFLGFVMQLTPYSV